LYNFLFNDYVQKVITEQKHVVLNYLVKLIRSSLSSKYKLHIMSKYNYFTVAYLREETFEIKPFKHLKTYTITLCYTTTVCTT
jgi:hypothetical protein